MLATCTLHSFAREMKALCPNCSHADTQIRCMPAQEACNHAWLSRCVQDACAPASAVFVLVESRITRACRRESGTIEGGTLRYAGAVWRFPRLEADHTLVRPRRKLLAAATTVAPPSAFNRRLRCPSSADPGIARLMLPTADPTFYHALSGLSRRHKFA